MNKLSELQPTAVFKHFEALTRIPRESGNEQAVSDYLVAFGRGLGLETIQEPCGNVIIKKPATPGYEQASTVILQGHMDMVCVKLDDMAFDFERDPIPIVIDGDFVKTEGTTLGADNGIAVAMTMALLESNTQQHPALTALFTTAEETGMDGVVALNPENIRGDILINIDSEEEGTLLASCAGGVNNIIEYTVNPAAPTYEQAFKVTIHGLSGGHSGIEINKNRANALKLMGRLMRAYEAFEHEIFMLRGGEKMNAIAKKAELGVVVTDVAAFRAATTAMADNFRSEFEIADSAIAVDIEAVAMPSVVFSRQDSQALTKIIRLIPYGVQTMSSGIDGLVESSNNLGVIEQDGDIIRFTSAIRSSVNTLKAELNDRMAIISELTNSNNYTVADYPEWTYKVNSAIRDLMVDVYRDMYHAELSVDAIHAGLECGFLKEKVGDIDMISLGPNLYDVHTPYEKLSISSTARVYNFLGEVLKRIN